MPRINSESPAPRPASAPPSGRGETPQSQVLPDIKVYGADASCVVAVVHRYLLQIVRDRMTATALSLLRRALTDLADEHPTFGYLCVIEPDAQVGMAPDVREGVDACVKRFSSRITGSAVVFEKGGFHATAVRSVVTAINIATRATHQNQVFADVRSAVSWLSPLTPGEPTAARLVQIIKHLREDGSASPPSSVL